MTDNLEKRATKGSVIVNGVEVQTYKTEIESLNSIEVEVGTTGPKGGDTGHGCRTYMRIKNTSCTDMRCESHYDTYGHSWVEITFGGDSELDTFYDALQFAIDVLGRETNGVDYCIPEPTRMEIRQANFAMYLNELCEHYRKTGKLSGMSEIQKRHHVTPVTQAQFYECDLHHAKGYIDQEFCNQVYAYVFDNTKATPAPKFKE